MIDLNDLRQRPEKYKEACLKKRVQVDVEEFLKLDQRYRDVKAHV